MRTGYSFVKIVEDGLSFFFERPQLSLRRLDDLKLCSSHFRSLSSVVRRCVFPRGPRKRCCAAAMNLKERLVGRKVGIVLSGGNLFVDQLERVLLR